MRPRRRLGSFVPLVGLVVWAAALLAPATVAAAEPDFGEPSITTTFGQGFEVTQPVTPNGPITRAELLVTQADSPGPLVIEVAPPVGDAEVPLQAGLEVGADGHILPNTPITARFRLTPADGSAPVLGPEVSTVYRDDRFDWQTVEGDVVRVHWYEGSRAFGERALRIGEDAVNDTADLLGVTEDEPVDIFIYADQGAFYDALGPGTRENVGGQANAEIRTLFALIGPSDIDDPWVSTVVPHELVHLVFDTAVNNPYHFPPRWLNEGLAMYLSEGYDSSNRRTVERAAGDGTMVPLDGLAGQFPTTATRFFQAYAESVSAVDYFIRTHGQDALVSLIRSYADGMTDDEAFREAIGMDVAGFDAAWLADLGAVVPVRHGPQPAPPGPVPDGWDVTAAGGSMGAVTPGASAVAAAASPAPAGAAGGPPVVDSPSSATVILGVIALALVLAGLGLGLLRLRRERGPAA